MANTAGRTAGDPKAVAGQIKAGETEDTSKGFSSPNWKADDYEKPTKAWKDDT